MREKKGGMGWEGVVVVKWVWLGGTEVNIEEKEGDTWEKDDD